MVSIFISLCKQACHYCDFHFSTNLKKKDEMIFAITKEIGLRKDEFKKETLETIYFGGGTPSILSNSDLKLVIDSVYQNYNVVNNPEIIWKENENAFYFYFFMNFILNNNA